MAVSGSRSGLLVRALPLASFYALTIAALTQSFSVYGQERSSLTVAMQYFGVASLICISIYNNRMRVFSVNANHVSLLLFILFVYILISSFWSISPSTTIVYSLVYVAMSVALGLEFSREEVSFIGSSRLLSWVLVAFLLLLPISLGVTDRSFGFVSPNLIASFSFALVFFSLFRVDIWSIGMNVLAVLLVFFSEGRTLLVAIAIFYFFYYSLPLVRSAASAVIFWIFLSLSAVIFFVYFEAIGPVFVKTVSGALGIEQESRLDLSFTGRVEHWEQGLRVFWMRPIEGFGFATRTFAGLSDMDLSVNAHSGVINSLLDLGVVGASLIWLIVLLSLVANIVNFYRSRSNFFRCCASFLISYTVVLAIEPNYISVSHPLSVIFIGIVSRHMYRRIGNA